MKKILTVAVFLAWAAVAAAADLYGPYTVDIVRVVDGDTVEVDIRLWPGLTQHATVRLRGVNTPESRGPVSDCEKAAGKAAREFTATFVKGGHAVLSEVGHDKYGRALGLLSINGKDLGEALIKAGHAKPYDGGHRDPWCK